MNPVTQVPSLTRADRARIGKIKFECHRLLDIIWGSSRQQRCNAYKWLHNNAGVNHFSEVKDYRTLWDARKKLQAEALARQILTIEDLDYV